MDENRVAPPEAGVFSLVMLASTPAGDTYTYAEYQRMLTASGFTQSTLHALPPQAAIIARA